MSTENAENKATDTIRKMIMDGQFEAAQTITETKLSAVLNLSRTPIRAAMKTLEAEGLLLKRDGRGYTARQISDTDLSDAFAVRGALEGLAAHKLAMTGLSRIARERLDTSLITTENVVKRGKIDKDSLEAYAVANLIFHKTIMQAADNQFIIDCASRLNILPPARLGAMLDTDHSITRLTISHAQHALIRRAIDTGDSDRAFSLMREHASYTDEYFDLF